MDSVVKLFPVERLCPHSLHNEGGECKVMLTYRHASQNYDK